MTQKFPALSAVNMMQKPEILLASPMNAKNLQNGFLNTQK
jgi:hypothetical protein